MTLLLVIIYAATLLYLCSIERFRHYALVVGMQGWLLLVIAFLQLNDASIGEKIFITAETLLIKGILVPFLLFRIIKRLQVNKTHPNSMSPIYITLIAIALMGLSMWLTSAVYTQGGNVIFFAVAIFGALIGLLLITVHRRIFAHLVGFLVIENSVLLLSFALGADIPMLINIGVLLDILMGVMLLGFFITKLSIETPTLDSQDLTNLKD